MTFFPHFARGGGGVGTKFIDITGGSAHCRPNYVHKFFIQKVTCNAGIISCAQWPFTNLDKSWHYILYKYLFPLIQDMKVSQTFCLPCYITVYTEWRRSARSTVGRRRDSVTKSSRSCRGRAACPPSSRQPPAIPGLPGSLVSMQAAASFVIVQFVRLNLFHTLLRHIPQVLLVTLSVIRMEQQSHQKWTQTSPVKVPLVYRT